MGVPNISNLGYFMYGIETSYGNEATPTISYPIYNETLTAENVIEVDDLIANSIEYSRAYTRDFNVTGGIELPFYYNLGGDILYAFFGKVTSTSSGGGLYQHVFVPHYEMPSYTFYVDRIQQAFIYPGSVCESLTLNFSRDRAPIRIETNWICQKEKAYTGTKPTFIIPNQLVFLNVNAKFYLNNIENKQIRSIRINMNRNIDTDEPKVISSGRFIEELATGKFDVTGDVTFRFKSMTEWKAFWGGINATEPQPEVMPVSAKIVVDGRDGNQFTLEMPKIVLSRRGGGTLSVNEPIEVTFDYQAIFDEATQHKIVATLINTQESYPL